MIKIFFKTTWRHLWKNSTYSLLNIFGLAIGICCAGLIFLWAEHELTFDQVNAKKDHLYQVNVNMTYGGNHFTMGSTPRPMGEAIKKEIPGIVNSSRISDEDQRLLFNVNDKSLYATGRFADPSLFSMFSFHFIQGDSSNPFPQLYSVVISESTAKKFFGDDKNITGKTLRVDNKNDYVVSGVVKDLPQNSTLQFEWLAPYEINNVQALARGDKSDAFDWRSYGPYTYVELDKKANVEEINKQLKNFIRHKASDQKTESFLFAMSQWRLYNEFVNGKPTGSGRIAEVRLLSIIAWIILLIACINFMNLATASSQKRAREVGVRKVLGAGKKKLIFQFVGESLLTSMIAAAFAIIFIGLSLPAFNLLMQKQLTVQLGNPMHWLGLLGITLICGLISGSYPSIYLSSFNPVSVLKGLKLKTGNASLIRKGLVVFQFAVSVVFIISTMVVYFQIQYVKARNLGFNKNNLIEVDMQHDFAKTFPLIKQDLLHTGMIQNAAKTDHVTIQGGNSDNRFTWQGKPKDNEVDICFRNVSPEFIATSGMQLFEGRDFTGEASEVNNVIINEAFAAMMGKGSPLGRIIHSPRNNDKDQFTDMTVIGVIKDYVYGNLYDARAQPVILLCQPQAQANYLYIRTKALGSIEQSLAAIQTVIKKDNPLYPLQYKLVDDEFSSMFFNEIQISNVSTVFASLAIIISCLGLFGLATYTAERRIKEIGIRKVLGASVSGLAGLLSKDFLQLVIIACLIAFPVSWWIMHNWLLTYDYRITIGWWVFLIAGFVAIFIALGTISFQAVKAALANPVKSLRTE